MKIKLCLILLLLIQSVIQAQWLLYPYMNKQQIKVETMLYSDSFAHTSIKPFLFYYKKLADSLNFIFVQLKDSTIGITISPVLNNSINQNLNWYQKYGFFTGVFYKKKLSLQLNILQNFLNPEKWLIDKNDSIGIIPGEGKYLKLNSNIWTKTLFNYNLHWHAFSFLWFDMGYGKHFLGEGHRSLFLSDNASSFPYVRGTAKRWKVQYVVLYSFLEEPRWKNFNMKYTRKNSTLHYLSWKINKSLSFHAFETVIWQTKDSIGNRYFDINYLNPIIFFRPIEFSLGSPDNVIMGAGFNISIKKKTHFYSQFILDEFKLDEWQNKKNWWGNKFGIQTGIKTAVKARNLNFFYRLEFNAIRPFTYSHSDYLRAWGHMHQPLAHPLGANFIEWLSQLSLNYKKWLFELYGVYFRQGEGTAYFNAGNNIFRSYDDKRQEYGNYMLIGANTNVKYLNLAIHYKIKPSWDLSFFTKGELLLLYKENFNPESQYFIHFGVSTRGISFDRY